MATQHKIGNASAVAMLSVAVLIDGVQALLTLTVVGSVFAVFLTFVAAIAFWIWFMLHGVSYTKDGGKKALIGLASVVGELIPFINAIPATTAGVLGIILVERAKEMKGRGGALDPKRAAAMARLARMRAARSQALQAARTARAAQQVRRGRAPEV